MGPFGFNDMYKHYEIEIDGETKDLVFTHLNFSVTHEFRSEMSENILKNYRNFYEGDTVTPLGEGFYDAMGVGHICDDLTNQTRTSYLEAHASFVVEGYPELSVDKILQKLTTVEFEDYYISSLSAEDLEYDDIDSVIDELKPVIVEVIRDYNLNLAERDYQKLILGKLSKIEI